MAASMRAMASTAAAKTFFARWLAEHAKTNVFATAEV